MFHLQKRLLFFVRIITVLLLAYCSKHETMDNGSLLFKMSDLMKATFMKVLVLISGNRVNYLVNNILLSHFNQTWLKLKAQ
jgi:hypothetical protein